MVKKWQHQDLNQELHWVAQAKLKTSKHRMIIGNGEPLDVVDYQTANREDCWDWKGLSAWDHRGHQMLEPDICKEFLTR